jgi:hypothetical protein
MAGEWGPTHPPAALRAGAVAIKQYGWYYTMHWRGGSDAAGRCYDVVDSPVDQWYDPSRPVRATQAEAVADTWAMTVWKDGRFVATGYRAGDGVCGAQEDGFHLLQQNASACAALGESTESLLRRYYGPDISIVTTGANDLTGDGVGDSVGMWTGGVLGVTSLSLLTTDSRAGVGLMAEQTATAPGGPSTTGPTIALQADEAKPGATVASPTRVLGTASVDLTGDGRADLVRLLADGRAALRVELRRATRSGFGPATTWWAGRGSASAGQADAVGLVAADFTGSGRAQVGLVEIRDPGTGRARVSILLLSPPSRGSSASSPRGRVVWRGWATGAQPQAVAADVTGDGLADLVLLETGANGSTSVAVAEASGRDRFGQVRQRGHVAMSLRDTTPLVGDVNGDGRDDLILATADRQGLLSIVALTATDDGFRHALWWPGRVSFGFSSSRIAVSDLDRDGRADLVVYRRSAASGSTLVYRFMNTGSRFVAHPWRTLPAVDWATFEVF